MKRSAARSRRTLQAGEYYFDHPVTAFEVFDTLAEGRVYVRELVIPEGYSMFDIADLVAREDFMSRDDFLAAASDPAPIRDLAPNAKSLEGFLFPATYGFPRHPSGQAMVDAMVKRFRQEWTTISAQPPNTQEPGAQQRDAQPSGVQAPPLEKIVTLASLVERETPKTRRAPVSRRSIRESLAPGRAVAVRPHGCLLLGTGGAIHRHAGRQRNSVRLAV